MPDLVSIDDRISEWASFLVDKLLTLKSLAHYRRLDTKGLTPSSLVFIMLAL